MPAHGARIGDGLWPVCGRAGPFNGADVVEPICGVLHDDCGALGHRVREAVDLADAGGNLLFVLCEVSRGVRGFDLLAVHVDDIRVVEIPADAYDVAIEPACRMRPARIIQAPMDVRLSIYLVPYYPIGRDLFCRGFKDAQPSYCGPAECGPLVRLNCCHRIRIL